MENYEKKIFKEIKYRIDNLMDVKANFYKKVEWKYKSVPHVNCKEYCFCDLEKKHILKLNIVENYIYISYEFFKNCRVDGNYRYIQKKSFKNSKDFIKFLYDNKDIKNELINVIISLGD